MYHIILKNGNVGIGTESMQAFQSYATLADLEAQSKRNSKSVETMLNEADLLTWINLKNGKTVKGSVHDPRFVSYATKKQVEDAGGNVKDAHLHSQPKKESK